MLLEYGVGMNADFIVGLLAAKTRAGVAHQQYSLPSCPSLIHLQIAAQHIETAAVPTWTSADTTGIDLAMTYNTTHYSLQHTTIATTSATK